VKTCPNEAILDAECAALAKKFGETYSYVKNKVTWLRWMEAMDDYAALQQVRNELEKRHESK
jgi:hypothetical protein